MDIKLEPVDEKYHNEAQSSNDNWYNVPIERKDVLESNVKIKTEPSDAVNGVSIKEEFCHSVEKIGAQESCSKLRIIKIEINNETVNTKNIEQENTTEYSEITIDEQNIKQAITDAEERFICHVCCIILKTQDSLNDHVNLHNRGSHTSSKSVVYRSVEDLKNVHKCNLCAFKCNKASRLKLHNMTHTGEKPLECDICSVKFRRLATLKMHRRTHTGEKPFGCEICSASFARSDVLKKHLIMHSGEKLHACHICTFRFASPRTLKLHKMVHAGDKPYNCDVCTYKCTRASSLKHHKMKHTGERPYLCDICPYKCNLSGSLKKHKTIHEREARKLEDSLKSRAQI